MSLLHKRMGYVAEPEPTPQNEPWLKAVSAKKSQIEGNANNASTSEQEFSSKLTLLPTSSLLAALKQRCNQI